MCVVTPFRGEGDTRVKSIKVAVIDSDEQKRSSFFQKKIGWTPSVATPGDTHPSEATVRVCPYVLLFPCVGPLINKSINDTDKCHPR